MEKETARIPEQRIFQYIEEDIIKLVDWEFGSIRRLKNLLPGSDAYLEEESYLKDIQDRKNEYITSMLDSVKIIVQDPDTSAEKKKAYADRAEEILYISQGSREAQTFRESMGYFMNSAGIYTRAVGSVAVNRMGTLPGQVIRGIWTGGTAVLNVLAEEGAGLFVPGGNLMMKGLRGIPDFVENLKNFAMDNPLSRFRGDVNALYDDLHKHVFELKDTMPKIELDAIHAEIERQRREDSQEERNKLLARMREIDAKIMAGREQKKQMEQKRVQEEQYNREIAHYSQARFAGSLVDEIINRAWEQVVKENAVASVPAIPESVAPSRTPYGGFYPMPPTHSLLSEHLLDYIENTNAPTDLEIQPFVPVQPSESIDETLDEALAEEEEDDILTQILFGIKPFGF